MWWMARAGGGRDRAGGARSSDGRTQPCEAVAMTAVVGDDCGGDCEHGDGGGGGQRWATAEGQWTADNRW